jgi:TM2 domain-containing membrane protein YozV
VPSSICSGKLILLPGPDTATISLFITGEVMPASRIFGFHAFEFNKRIAAIIYYLIYHEHIGIIFVMLLIWVTTFHIFTLNKRKSGLRPDNQQFSYLYEKQDFR